MGPRRRNRRAIARAVATVETLENRRLLANLGPDGFGYTVEPLPLQQGVELSDGGAGVITLHDSVDDDSLTIDLGGNTFTFYGRKYTGADQLFASSNGLITFNNANAFYTNTSIESATEERMIAVLWDDWIGNAAECQYKLDEAGDRLIIQWNAMHYSESPETVQFQAILQLNTGDEAGDIIFNYADLDTGDANAEGVSATVGMKDGASPSQLLEVSYDEDSSLVGTGKAIKITVGEPGHPRANAGPSKSVLEGTNGLTFQLDGSDSNDPDGDALTYAWDLDDDGIFGETGNDAAFGDETGIKPVFHLTGTLDGPARYDITLRVTDTNDMNGYASTFVAVEPVRPVVNFTVSSNPAAFAETTFTLTTDQPNGEFTYTVDFGDGGYDYFSGSGSSTQGIHTFMDAGDYEVTVTASDGVTESLPLTKTVTVGNRPDVVVFDGVLFIGGTTSADTITVAVDDDTFTIVRNGTTKTFSTESFSRIDIDTGEGADVVTIDADVTMEADVESGAGADTVTTGSGDDFVWGRDGNNVINTGAGNDYVTCGNDGDTVDTGDGNDFIDANSSGNDSLSTGAGNDSVQVGVGPGNDTGATVDLGDGDDGVFGRYATLVRGGAGNDSFGLEFAATLEGGDGDDYFRCMQPGSSDYGVAIFGNDGDDRIYTGGGADSIYGGAGRDRVHSGAGGDLVSGGGGNDHLFGQGGHDRLYGGAGDDRLEGLGGNDRLTGGAGSDLVHGGEGDNTAYDVNESEDDLLEIQHTA